METSYDDYERFRAFDLAFHAIVMKASGNEVGLTIVRTIHRHGGRHAAPLLRILRAISSSGRSRSHRAIYEALEAGDGGRAGDLISGHIANAWAERKRNQTALDSS